MRIGEIADLASVTVRTVRYYHHKGVLAEPLRRSNGYRIYTVDDLVSLLRIRQLTDSGISLEHARVILDGSEGPTDELLDEVQSALEQRIEDLTAQRDRLIHARASGRIGLSKLAAALTTTPSDIPVSALFAHLYGNGHQADHLAETLCRPEVSARIETAQRQFESVDETTTTAGLADLTRQVVSIVDDYVDDVPAVADEGAHLLLSLVERGLNDRQKAFLRALWGE